MRILALSALLLLLLPAAASAGRAERVRVEVGGSARGEPIFGWRLDYAASPGGSRIVVERRAVAVELTDSAGVEAGSGCTQLAPDRVRCTEIDHALVDAGDGDDVVEVDGFVNELLHVVRGGTGDDRLRSAGRVEGGEGADVLQGAGRSATLDGGPGPDELLGGPGEDRASYFARPDAVYADLEGDADDGAPGEGDRVDAAIEGLTGGYGSDVLVGDDDPNLLSGGDDYRSSAPDRVSAAGGDDELAVTPDDDAAGGAGDDRIRVGFPVAAAPVGRTDGGPGDDALSGTIATERFVGGPGHDQIDGIGGADLIEAVDGETDAIQCQFGGGTREATARIDVLDVTERCRRIERTGSARLVIALLSRRGFAASCPSDHGRRCRARVRVLRGRTPVLDVRIALRPGRYDIFERRRALPRAPLRVRVDTRDSTGRLRTFTVVPPR